MLVLLNFLSKTALKAKISPTNLLLGQSPEPCCWLFRRGAASSILPLLGEGSSPRAHTPRIRPTLPGQPRGNYCSEPQPLFSACSKSQLCCSREGDKTVCHFSGPFFKRVKDKAFVLAEAMPNLTERRLTKGPFTSSGRARLPKTPRHTSRSQTVLLLRGTPAPLEPGPRRSPPCTKPSSVQSDGPTRWIRLDWL